MPNVRDDRDTPLLRERDGEDVGVIWVEREDKYFCRRDWTGQITLKPLQKIAPTRTSTVSPSGPHLRDCQHKTTTEATGIMPDAV
jgi:hypothetical protein